MVIGSVFDRSGAALASGAPISRPVCFRECSARNRSSPARRLLAGAYDEWGILYSPHGDVTQSSAALTEFAIRSIDRTRHIDLAGLADRATRETERVDVVTWPGEHYQLLAGLAEVWGDGDPISVVEVGTYTGSISTCVAVHTVRRAGHHVRSCAVGLVRAHDAESGRFRGSARTAPRRPVGSGHVCRTRVPTLASADIVFVDAPKDGQFEYQFLPWLFVVEPERSQLVVLDDVRVVPMINLWRSLPLPKLDVASFGHWSGTGLVIRDRAVHWTPPSSRLARDVRPLLRRRWRQH